MLESEIAFAAIGIGHGIGVAAVGTRKRDRAAFVLGRAVRQQRGCRRGPRV